LAVARRLEGVANVLDCRQAFGLGPCDGDDIEAGALFEQMMAFQPRQGESREATLFAGINRFGRVAALMRAAGFDLHENNGALIDRDEIDFTESAASASIDNRVAKSPQEAFGQPFAA